MTTPPHDLPDLLKLRSWRTWLLVMVGVGQGVQYLIAPARPLHSDAYASLTLLGTGGWRVIGVLVLIYAWLLIPAGTRPAGHIAGAVIYLLLMWATAINLYWPSFSILAAGLNCGEFWLWLRNRSRDRS